MGVHPKSDESSTSAFQVRLLHDDDHVRGRRTTCIQQLFQLNLIEHSALDNDRLRFAMRNPELPRSQWARELFSDFAECGGGGSSSDRVDVDTGRTRDVAREHTEPRVSLHKNQLRLGRLDVKPINIDTQYERC